MRLRKRPKDPIEHEKLLRPIEVAIREAIAASRFRADVSQETNRWGQIIRIDYVRRRSYRDYCGQHPNGCVVANKPHTRERLLEGADWVGFNDGLNDALDRLAADIDVWSYNREASPGGRYFIRKGLERRVEYASHEVHFFGRFGFLWDRDGLHQNWIGHEAPRSEFPDDTPGIPCWSREDEERMAALPEYQEVD